MKYINYFQNFLPFSKNAQAVVLFHFLLYFEKIDVIQCDLIEFYSFVLPFRRKFHLKLKHVQLSIVNIRKTKLYWYRIYYIKLPGILFSF